MRMVSDDNDYAEETLDNLESGTAFPQRREHIGIRAPPIQMEFSDQRGHTRRLLDFLKAHPSLDWIKKLRFSSPTTVFQQTVDQREEVSVSVPSPVGIRRHFNIHFIRKIKWSSIMSICKEWTENPMNIALLIWLICVAVSASMQFMLLLGLLDKAFPTKSTRNRWIEINNQVLNALFTLMSLYQHPKLFHHFVLLCRWRPNDVTELRKIYCKNGAYRPREWAHMMVVLVLLHITCFAQYAMCGLYWGYTATHRPEFAEDLFLALGTAAPAFAGAYTVYSPLGREYNLTDVELDEEYNVSDSSANTNLNFYGRKVAVITPEWTGGLFDCSGDSTRVGYLSFFFCTFCVFGWNMERLGFGNMYVHTVTFLLLCVAPFWIFNIAALNIRNQVIGDIVGISGLVLCVFGLLYGGFWRIQMRKRFKLPGNTFCCSSASLTDYMQWMFCWACSLAQEVRTGNFYHVEEDSLYRKHVENDEEENQSLLEILPCERAIILDSSFALPNLNIIGREYTRQGGKINDTEERELDSRLAINYTVAPPIQTSMHLQDRIDNEVAIEPLPDSPLLQGQSDSAVSTKVVELMSN